MSFGEPPKPKPQATPAVLASSTNTPDPTATTPTPQSLISTGATGLARKAKTIKTSLIGGTQ